MLRLFAVDDDDDGDDDDGDDDDDYHYYYCIINTFWRSHNDKNSLQPLFILTQ